MDVVQRNCGGAPLSVAPAREFAKGVGYGDGYHRLESLRVTVSYGDGFPGASVFYHSGMEGT